MTEGASDGAVGIIARVSLQSMTLFGKLLGVNCGQV